MKQKTDLNQVKCEIGLKNQKKKAMALKEKFDEKLQQQQQQKTFEREKKHSKFDPHSIIEIDYRSIIKKTNC
mgnify:CR=1 FL=1